MSIRSKMDGYYNRKCYSKPISKVAGFLVSCMVFAITLQGCSIIPEEEEVMAPSLVEPVKLTYNLYDVKRKTIADEAKGSGVFIYNERSDLLYKFSGSRLKAIYVDLGDNVTKGMLVAELENENLLDMIKQMEMDLYKAELRLELVEIDRQSKLAGQNPSSDELKKAEINIKLQQLDVDSIEYKLANLKRDYDRTRLVSTLNGIVTYVSDAKEGDTIQPYTTLIEVADPKELVLDWQYSDSSKLSMLNTGTEVDIEIDSVKYKGKIIATPKDFLGKPEGEKNRNTIRIEVEGLPEDISAGKDANISVTLKKKDNVLVIPKDALRTEVSGTYVVVLKDSLKRERRVETGMMTVTEVEILDGLEEGDQVVLR